MPFQLSISGVLLLLFQPTAMQSAAPKHLISFSEPPPGGIVSMVHAVPFQLSISGSVP